MVWLRNGIMSFPPGALVLPGAEFDEVESVCALHNMPAKMRIAPINKPGFRIFRIAAGRRMDTLKLYVIFRYVSAVQAPGEQQERRTANRIFNPESRK
jgi:hypothetical protein